MVAKATTMPPANTTLIPIAVTMPAVPSGDRIVNSNAMKPAATMEGEEGRDAQTDAARHLLAPSRERRAMGVKSSAWW